jgi:hypothetical protein
MNGIKLSLDTSSTRCSRIRPRPLGCLTSTAECGHLGPTQASTTNRDRDDRLGVGLLPEDPALNRTQIRLIDLDVADEPLAAETHHCCPVPVQHRPRRLVGARPQRPRCRGRDAVLLAGHLPRRREEQLSNVVDSVMKNDQAATFSFVVVWSSVTLMPSLYFAPSSTSLTSSWPLNRRHRSWAASSSL